MKIFDYFTATYSELSESITYARVDDEVVRTSLKELYFDLMLRFCRVADLEKN